MRYAEFMDAKDRAELAKADRKVAEGRELRRRIMTRLRARAYRQRNRNKEPTGKPPANTPR